MFVEVGIMLEFKSEFFLSFFWVFFECVKGFRWFGITERPAGARLNKKFYPLKRLSSSLGTTFISSPKNVKNTWKNFPTFNSSMTKSL